MTTVIRPNKYVESTERFRNIHHGAVPQGAFNTLRTPVACPIPFLLLTYDNDANIPEWFAPVVNIVGHVGILAEKHSSGMRSFDVRCTSYPELSGKYKPSVFMLRYFDIDGRWEAY